MNFLIIRPISLGDANQKVNYAKLFDIKETPTIIILDNDGIVLQTTDLSDIYTLAESINI